MSFNAFFVFFVMGKLQDELSAEGGFPRADVSDHNVQPPEQPDRKFQILQTTKVLGRLEKKFRLRRIGEGLLLEI
jgi:hypothetical protein